MTLREYLETNDISYDEFAKMMGCGRSTIYRWVSGESDITVRDAYKVLWVTDGFVCPHDFIEEIHLRESSH